MSRNHLFTSKRSILPFTNLYILAFQFLIVLEEIFRNAEEHLVYIGDVAERTRVKHRHAQNLVVLLATIGHVKCANHTASANCTRNHRSRAVNQHIQSIAIIGLGTRDKTVRARIAHGTQKATVKTEHMEAFVVFVFQIRIFADFHDAINFIGIFASDRKIKVINRHLFSVAHFELYYHFVTTLSTNLVFIQKL